MAQYLRLLPPIFGGSGDEPDAPNTSTPDPGASPPGDPGGAATPAEPQSFIDPKDLPPELKPHWTRMHRAYTKALEKSKQAGGGEHAANVQRFWSDPDYASQIIQARAQQLGYRLTKAEAREMARDAAGSAPAGDGSLPPELSWMEPHIARAVEARLQPYKQRAQTQEVSAKTAEFDELAEELAETAPGWEAHEDEMSELLSFLTSSRLRDRRWGSKLALLHNLVTGQAHAAVTLARRTADAARARTGTGQPGRSVAPNLSDQIRKAPTTNDAWKLAEQAGLEEARRRGLG